MDVWGVLAPRWLVVFKDLLYYIFCRKNVAWIENCQFERSVYETLKLEACSKDTESKGKVCS